MSSFLLIESGATKLAWQLSTPKELLAQGTQPGLHPQLVTPAQWRDQLHELQRTLPALPDHIYYYGTGCLSREGREQVQAFFKKFWPSPLALTVETDLLGACRALCQQSDGLVAILGTGSNTAVFKNQRILHQRGGFGYVLGDEGSGADLGRGLLQAFLRNDLPAELAHVLRSEYRLDRGKIIEALYRGEAPSRFLAQFGPLLSEHRELPFVQFLLRRSFRQLVLYYLSPLAELTQLKEVYCIGSVAKYFQEELAAVFSEQGLAIGNVLETPIDELRRWHQEGLG